VTPSAPARRPASAAAPGGFTLLEVLVALAILGTAVIMSIQAVGQGLRLLKAAGDQQQAIIVADQKARELLVPTEGSDSGTTGRFSWQRTSQVLETPELTPVDEPPQWRVFQISVVVTWDDQRRLEVATLRTVPATSDPTRAADPFATQSGGGTSDTSGTSRSGRASDSGSASQSGRSSDGSSSSRSGRTDAGGTSGSGTSDGSGVSRGTGTSGAGRPTSGGTRSPSSRSRGDGSQ
jgi:type II secretion system protein I